MAKGLRNDPAGLPYDCWQEWWPFKFEIMSKNLFFPAVRTTSVLYFIYKMAFSDPDLDWHQVMEFDGSSAGRMTGDIVAKMVFGFIFVSFILYQFRQAKSEFRQQASSKDRLRLLSMIWSLIFYPVAAASLFNIHFKVDNSNFIDYLTNFYTVSTLIGVAAGAIVIIRDIKIFRGLKKNRNVLQQQL